MDLEALERRIRRLEDLEAIKQLKARYAAYCDANYDADALADLFTSDAVWDGGMLGRSEGREAIRQFQQINGLKVDGIVGKQTWEKLQPYAEVASSSGELSAAEPLK